MWRFARLASSTFSYTPVLRCGSCLELPNAFTVSRDIGDCLVHQGNQHVQQEDVGQDYKEEEEEHDKVLELHVLMEFQVTHPNGELEELQRSSKHPCVHILFFLLFSWEGRVVVRSLSGQREDSLKEKVRIKEVPSDSSLFHPHFVPITSFSQDFVQDLRSTHGAVQTSKHHLCHQILPPFPLRIDKSTPVAKPKRKIP